MQKIKNLKTKIIDFWKKNYKRKRFWIIVVVCIILIFSILKPKNNAEIVTNIATVGNLKQTVLATGQVTSNVDLDLSFRSSGIVKNIKVKIGDKVKKGDILATLIQDAEQANLTQARGALAFARAKLQKTIEGASNEEIALAQIALDNAKRDYENVKNTQSTLVKNARAAMLSTDLVMTPDNGNIETSRPTISGTYNGNQEGNYEMSIDLFKNGGTFMLYGIEKMDGEIITDGKLPFGTKGLFIEFPDDFSPRSNDVWKVEIPNKKSPYYITNLNAYESALKTEAQAIASAQALVDQRQAEYNLKTASARNVDIDLANADVISAEGVYQSALAKYNDSVITAPSDGTITHIDIKEGEQIGAQSRAIVLQDVSNMYLEANINEANIVNVRTGMPVEITYDAFGPDKIFTGYISSVDPASTIIGGVVNYKINASIEKTDGLRPGMTANMIIKSNEKNNVIAIPRRAISLDQNGGSLVKIITNTKTKKYKEFSVITGMEGDGGMIEIVSGLSSGDEYVVLSNSK